MQPITDEELYRQRAENPLASLSRFPTDPQTILLAQQALQFIPALPFVELYEPYIQQPQIARSASFRCLTQRQSAQLGLMQQEMFGPAHQLLKRLACADWTDESLFGALARKRVQFTGFYPQFRNDQQRYLRDFLFGASANLNLFSHVQQYIFAQLPEFIAILDLEQICFRVPCEEAFQAVVNFLESLEFAQFDLSASAASAGFQPDFCQHCAQFQQAALPSGRVAELILYFKNLAVQLLSGTFGMPVAGLVRSADGADPQAHLSGLQNLQPPPADLSAGLSAPARDWMHKFPSLYDPQLVDATRFSPLERALVQCNAQLGSQFGVLRIGERRLQGDSQYNTPIGAPAVSQPALVAALNLYHQQFYGRQTEWVEFLLRFFCQNQAYRAAELEISSAVFEDSISFVTSAGVDFRGLTAYLMLAGRLAFALYSYNRKYQFIYDKILRNITNDRTVLADLQIGTNELDFIAANLARFQSSELLLQQQGRQQGKQKAFWIILKQLRMNGIQFLNDDALRKLDNELFKGLQARQSDAGLLSKVDCRVDVQGQNQRFETASLSKFYFNCNRLEGEDPGAEGSIMQRLFSMIGAARQ